MSAQLRVLDLDVQLDSFAPSNHALWPDRSLCWLSGPDVPAGGPPPHRLPSGEWIEPSDYSDGYWTGSASLPRIGQKDNVNLILYRPPPQVYAQPDVRKSMFPFDYTHAGFDTSQFDELADELASAKRIGKPPCFASA